MENASHRSSDFIKHVFTLISGTAIAQLIPIILSPFLRRWISLEDYALFEVFFRLISILSIVVALRYPMAVVLPKDDKEANNVVGAALSFCVSSPPRCATHVQLNVNLWRSASPARQ